MSEPLTAPAALTMTLFGVMLTLVQGQPLPRLRSRKAPWLLALLTLRHNRPVEREWLAGTLWPDADQSQANANLRPVLSELRKALGSEGARLQSPDRHTLLLNLEGAEVDLIRFDAAIRSRSLTDFEQASSLYRGPLLEGCSEEWVYQERAPREQQCLEALQKLAEAALTAGKSAEAIGFYQKAVRIDPWWDTARRGLMDALAKSGDSNAALQVYREFVELLRSDPNAVPDEQTSALYARLRAEARHRAVSRAVVTAETPPVPLVTGYLPHSLTDLVGREDERLEVADRLRRARLVTLTGLGGIGKTRLAIEVASERVREYADGVWLVSLETLSNGRMLAQQIASVLKLKDESGRTVLQSVTEHLRKRRLLLVLDNCEHLLESSAQIAEHLLRECAGVCILATSREALGVTGEAIWAVPALAAPDPAHLPQARATLLRVLMGYESVQLFVERAQAVQKTFSLNRDNALPTAQICSRLEGIPLALELAAARVKAMTVEQIAERLDDHLSLLKGGNRASRSRQQTLRATLDWSHNLLAEPGRTLLRRLSVFAGDCSLEAVEQVCSDSEAETVLNGNKAGTKTAGAIENRKSKIENDEVLDLLTSLVDKSLLIFQDGEREAGGRYRLGETVRQYAEERLRVSGEREWIQARHRNWMLAFATEAGRHLNGPDQEIWLRRLETEQANLRATLAWTAREENEATELQLVGTLWRFWYMRGNYREGRQYLESALMHPKSQVRTALRARALNGAGVLAYFQSDYDSARSLLEESRDIYRELEDPSGIAFVLNNLSNVANSQGDYAAARVLYEESLALKRELGDRQSIALTLSNLGTVLRHLGDYAGAKALYEESLDIRRQTGDRYGVAMSLTNMGNLSHIQGHFAAAQPLYEESLYLSRELGDRQGIARSLISLGNALYQQGDVASAQALYQEGLSLCRELGDRAGLAMSFGNLGTVAYSQGEAVTARALHEESLRLFQAMGDKEGVAGSLGGLADVMLVQDMPRNAICLWGAISRLRESIGLLPHPHEQVKLEQQAEQSRALLGADAFAVAWEEGRAMTSEEAVAFALRTEKAARIS